MKDDNDMTLAEMAIKMKQLQDEHASIKRFAAEVWKEVDKLRFSLIPDKMEELGIEATKVTGVGRISIRDELSCSTKNKQALMEWLEDHDHGDLIADTVNSSTLKAFIKEQIELGNDIPGDEIVNLKPYKMATITKA